MTPKICLEDGNLVVRGKTILSQVPHNIELTPASVEDGAFVGATSSCSKSLHVFPMGVFECIVYSNLLITWLSLLRVGFEKQGTPDHVLFPVQAMVDDSENGKLWERCASGDPIHAD